MLPAAVHTSWYLWKRVQVLHYRAIKNAFPRSPFKVLVRILMNLIGRGYRGRSIFSSILIPYVIVWLNDAWHDSNYFLRRVVLMKTTVYVMCEHVLKKYWFVDRSCTNKRCDCRRMISAQHNCPAPGSKMTTVQAILYGSGGAENESLRSDHMRNIIALMKNVRMCRMKNAQSDQKRLDCTSFI